MPVIGCPDCKSTNTARRRRGILDQIRSIFNSWPYRCLRCGRCFYAGQRYPGYDRTERRQQQRPSSAPRNPGSQESNGPRVAYQTETVRPHAKIVLEADTQDQMDAILMALSRAVSMHNGTTRERDRASRAAHV